MKKDKLLERWLKRKKDNSRTTITSDTEISKKPVEVSTPLSYGQQRLMFLQQLFPDNPFYNYADVYALNGKLEIDYLIQGFKSIVQRHAILRTTYHFEEDQVIQKIEEEAKFDYDFFDVSSFPSELQRGKAEELAIKVSQQPFDLNQSPLLNVTLIKQAERTHLMVITMHHIITDKWSMKVLREELSIVYKALLKGQQPTLNPLPFQYEDYAYWKRSKPLNTENLEYWKNKLAGSVPLLNLPGDHKRPVRPTFKGAYNVQHFSEETSNQLRALSKKYNVTLYVFLLTIYKILLYRYTGQEDILVGTPFTSRDQSKLESLIGFFNDTLVLRSNLSDDPMFLDLLDHVRKNVMEAFSHQGIPFETLVKELKPERYLSSNPLFQVMFIFHSVPETPSFGSDLSLKHEPFDFGVSKFDLTLYIADDKGPLSATIEYATDLFEKPTIERMQEHLKVLIESILERQEQRISSLPIITQKEKQQQLVEWNKTKAPIPNIEGIHHLFEKYARETPDKEALKFKNEVLSYFELNNKANIIARKLQELGVKPNTFVGLCADKSMNLILGILGILKTGGAYLPIDPEYPADRIKFMLNDTAAPFVLCQAEHIKKIKEGNSKIVTFKDIYEEEQSPGMFIPPKVRSSDLAYIIYTSGSSGIPKGVPVSHGNIIHSTTVRFDYYPEQPKCFLLLSSFAFDSSCVGIFWTLCSGGTLVLSEEKVEQDMDGLGQLILKHKVTHTLLLPSLYSLLLKQSEQQMLQSLTTVIVAGEPCSSHLCVQHFETLPGVNFFNEYGPTEASVWCTVHQLCPEDGKRLVPIGRPINNTEIYILDKYLQSVPVGVSGELYIGGSGVTNGYLNREELTNERFLDHPFEKASNRKIYKSGDLARYRPDGLIEFLGRADQQVKIRGYRIELSEIQEVLKDYSFIKEAVVMVKNNDMIASGQNTVDEVEVLLNRLQEMDDAEVEKLLKPIEKLTETEQNYLLDKL